MFPRYEENRGYLQNEFVNCPWDESTGMNPDELEKQINALWDTRGTDAVSVAKARIQRYIVQNAQIEVNPHSLFPGKRNKEKKGWKERHKLQNSNKSNHIL